MHQVTYAALFAILSFTIIGCAPFHFSDRRAGMCNELNSEMIFSGSNTIDRVADIQRAEEPLIKSQYDKKCTK
ncbi:MAG: hypothetical protein WAW86_00075 [Gammaproteobacteria bacterium]